MHKSIIIRRSKFFATAASERWQRNSSLETIELPEDDPDIFDIYLHCIYSNAMDVGDPEEYLQGETSDMSAQQTVFYRTAKTYMLADKLGDVMAANICLNSMIRHSSTIHVLPTGHTIELVFNETMETSLLRRMIVDLFVFEAHIDAIKTVTQDPRIPRAFLCAVLEKKAKLENECADMVVCEVFAMGLVENQRCLYHQHDETHPSCVGWPDGYC